MYKYVISDNAMVDITLIRAYDKARYNSKKRLLLLEPEDLAPDRPAAPTDAFLGTTESDLFLIALRRLRPKTSKAGPGE
jgi:hypothetical protein